MQTARSGPPVRTPDTRRAAAACLERLLTQRLAPRGRAVSPLDAMRAAADCLERDAATSERVWIVRADAREPSADADHVAAQIGAFVPARFAALGADSAVPGAGAGTRAPNARWIAAVALRLLADDGRVPADWAAQAMRRHASG
ncbi:hypothetical protein [Burkholderia contaminans]|uniref:hypothetical protein n=1 Tax=Burkholderia contaminans TaxID=488447 RepID=UPI000F578ECA|nr:hypothetical protein [Burkholderia contaminans]RQS94561.1 hypothetical protein DF035_29180 [Burkholderia contaminans]